MANNYLKNEDLYSELKISIEKGVMSNKLGEMFILMVNNVGKHRYYNGYTFLDDMKSVALLVICKYWQKYDLSKKNPFAYFTQCIKMSFLATMKKEQAKIWKRAAIFQSVIPGYEINQDDLWDTTQFGPQEGYEDNQD